MDVKASYGFADSEYLSLIKQTQQMLLRLLLLSAVASSAVGDAFGQSLQDVKHIIFFMQENRAMDHYFGKLSGVRGFNDRAAPPLRSGLNSF